MNTYLQTTFAFFSTLLMTALGSAANPRLDLNDVSWVWPLHKTEADVDGLIAMDSLKDSTGAAIWSDKQFGELLELAESDDAKVGNKKIRLNFEFKTKATWKIAGISIDPSAPGANEATVKKLGSSPQIRLIVQPVTKDNGKAVVHDFAAHMIFSFAANGQRGVPDKVKFKSILEGVDAVKKRSIDNGVSTSGPFGVHPGLSANVNGLDTAMREILLTHLTEKNLSAMSIMGLPNDFEPWIFVALSPTTSGFKRVPFLPPQMLSFVPPEGVSPSPIANNLNSIGSELFVADAAMRKGVATSVLFVEGVRVDELAIVGKDTGGNNVTDTSVKNQNIPDIVANPMKSHFFNTDCVSCHTESQRRSILQLPVSESAFQVNGNPPKIADDVVSKHRWNVCNFGWFSDALDSQRLTVATVTQRTANETAEVVAFIEREYC